MNSSMRAKTAADIADPRYGQSVIGVAGRPPFSYTIGNHGRGLPELVIVGLGPLDACYVLNTLGKMQRERGEPLLGDLSLGEGAKQPVRLQPIRDRGLVHDVYTCQVFSFYGTEEYEVTQVLVPDAEGRFPGDPGCAEPFRRQTVL